MPAQLHVCGPYRSLAEQHTAEALRDALPAVWDVFAGRQIEAGTTIRDVDLILVGKNVVVVADEKSWGGRVTAAEVRWRGADGRPRANPVAAVESLARMVAGVLDRKVPALARARDQTGASRHHVVVARVVFSDPDVVIVDSTPAIDERIVRLDDAARVLVELDKRLGATLRLDDAWREAIVTYLEGRPPRDDRPERFGAYVVDDSLAPDGIIHRYLAHHEDGRSCVLEVHPLPPGTAERAAARTRIVREYDAIRSLPHDIGRHVPSVDPYFDEDDAIVIPVVGRGELPLADSPRPDDDRFRRVAVQAFAVLRQIHANGVTHRAVSPATVGLTTDDDVVLSGFRSARIDDAVTVIRAEDDDADSPWASYRAPECESSLSSASTSSDVHSLALTLLAWKVGATTDDADSVRKARAAATVEAARFPALARATERQPGNRPSAAEVHDELLRGGPAPSIERGTRVDGKYTLERRLGAGATAQTWVARHDALGVERVIKLFQGEAEGLLAEFKALEQLTDERVVRVFDTFGDPAPGGLVMEYVPGPTIRDLLTREQLIETDRLLRIARDIFGGLAYAHARGILHRDISPQNVVIPERRHTDAVIIDFGLAARADEELTSTVGTPRYRAPEIASGGSWTAAADVYSAAAVLLELTTGIAPSRAGTQLDDGASRRRRAEAAYGTALIGTLLRAAAADSSDRTASAQAVLDELRLIGAPSPNGGEWTPAPAPSDDHATAENVPLAPRTNPTVDALRRTLTHTTARNDLNRGLDDPFARETYVETNLDRQLVTSLLARELDLVVLTGNPGDGKTAFIERFRATLEERGATNSEDAPVLDSHTGWHKVLHGHSYIAVLDASERSGELSADEILHAALAPIVYSSGQATVLVAANDGRLIDFFRRFGNDPYERIWPPLAEQLDGKGTAIDRVLLVDLKRRSLVSLDDPKDSLFSRLLEPLVAPDRWDVCRGCVASTTCAIRGAAQALTRDEVRDSIHDLLLTSHLRRRRRATLRDVRSTIAWLVTGDEDCEAMIGLWQRGLDASRDPDRSLGRRAFVPPIGDELGGEWADLDPRALPAPFVERQLEARLADPDDGGRVEAGWTIESLKRQAALGLEPVERRSELSAYRWLARFRAALQGPADDGLIETLLDGLSRILGTPTGAGLAVRMTTESPDGATVVRVIPRDAFTLTPRPTNALVETATDTLELFHRGTHALLRLNLDVFELVMRVASGLNPSAPELRPILEEIELFRERLLRAPSAEIRILESNGRTHRVRREGAEILREVLR